MTQGSDLGDHQWHWDTDPVRRSNKAEKLGRILSRLCQPREGAWALDIGSGSGYVPIRLKEMGWNVVAVDVGDYRVVHGANFVLARSESLPFRSEAFSVAVSNHVIEHVADPRAHLAEVRRVMQPGGIAYVATPNRLWFLEPHYRLPFLSWMPRRLADNYVRLLRRGPDFDVSLLTRHGLIDLASQVGLECQDLTEWAVTEMRQVEGSALARLATVLPRGLLGRLAWAVPTLVFALRPVKTHSADVDQ